MAGESDLRLVFSDQNDACAKDMREVKQMTENAARHFGESMVWFITTVLIQFNSSKWEFSFAWVPRKLLCTLSAIPVAPVRVQEGQGPNAEIQRQTRA